MARPQKAGGKRGSAARTQKASRAKGGNYKTRSQKTSGSSKNASRAKPLITEKRQIERLARELEEVRQQQAASSRVLHIIGASPGALTPVFQAIVKSAVEVCQARFGAVFRMEGGLLHLVADYNFGATQRQLLEAEYPVAPSRGRVSGRSILTRSTVQIPDTDADKDYTGGNAKQSGFRSLLAAPLLKGDQAIGSIVIYKAEPGTFPPQQMASLQNFATQAVIAIENARLFNETRETLERQTATAEILKVIASSPADVQPVFEAIVSSAARLFEPCTATITTVRDGQLHWEATAASISGFNVERVREMYPFPFDPDRSSSARAVLERRIIEIPDVAAPDVPEMARRGAAIGAFRSITNVPLIDQNQGIGTIVFTHPDVGFRFSDRQLALVQTFADQAVIAIGNVRLFEEVQAKTRDLSDSLQQQTATADALKVISRSAFDLQTVLQTLVESAAKLCNASIANIRMRDGDVLRAQAWVGASEDIIEYVRTHTIRRGRRHVIGRAFLTGELVHVPDVLADPEYGPDVSVQRWGYRAILAVPMVREGRVEGVFSLVRYEPRAFSDREIDLVRTFVDQALIAIENVRLFNEVQAKTLDLQESLQQQTATADVLKVISRSAFDLEPVLDALLSSACRLCEADLGTIRYREGGEFRLATTFGFKPEWIELFRTYSTKPDRSSVFGRTIIEGHIVHIPDLLADPDYDRPEAQKLMGFRAALGVPLTREGETFGVINLFRFNVGSFEDKQIELVQTFADQAVIAIENVRLFEQVQAKTRDLEESLQQQTATADVLKVISRSAFDLQSVLYTLVESAARLCDADEGTIFQPKEEAFRLSASWGLSAKRRSFLANYRFKPSNETTIGRVLLEGRTIHIEDSQADPNYRLADPEPVRTRLGVPLLREGAPIGVFVLGRRGEAHPFDERQIELVKTFADQAVIAIENVRLFDEVQARTRELSEALTYQTGSSNILRVIASSPTDVEPVLEAIVASACQLCEADDAAVLLKDGDDLRFSAHHGPISIDIGKWPINRGWVAGRAFLDQTPVHVRDLLSDEGEEFPDGRELAQHTGPRVIHTILAVPLLRETESIGAILLRRTELQPFNEKQVTLLQSFADQAVIAIENTRLFNETKEALERQTATADILKVIASSPDSVRPVFEAIAERSKSLVDALSTTVFTLADGLMHLQAFSPTNPEADALLQSMFPASLSSFSWSESILKREIFRVEDTELESTELREIARRRGFRSMLLVPLVREGMPIGLISVTRAEPGLFAEHHVQLLQTFADQAVIAIGNVRLFDEVKARTDDLRESLQQQTATADVLKIISRSSTDLTTALDTLVETVMHLCRADQAVMFRRRDDKYHMVAERGNSAEARLFISSHPLTTDDRGTVTARVAMERRPVHIPDVLQDPEYTYKEGQKVIGFRTILGIPLLREQNLIGIFSIQRRHVEPFADREIELATTFADQAVIAIENARLFEELRDRQAELRVTFDNMGDGVVMFDAAGRLAAWNRNFQEMIELPEAFLAGRPSRSEYFRYLADRGEFISADLEAQLGRTVDDIGLEMRYERTRPDGRVVEVRRNPVPGGGSVFIYSDITQRKRAEEAIRAARDAAERTLRELQTAQASLVHAQKMAALGQVTAGIAHEIKNPLNFVNNFAGLSVELLDELKNAAAAVGTIDRDKREEITETIGMLTGNLEKIVEHGRRADSIVRSMLQHSRGSSDDWQPTDLNGLVEEALNLAYHGARAQDPNFDIALEYDLDRHLAPVDVVRQELTRVLLNLIGNGIYAANERSRTSDRTYRPALKVTTRGFDESVEVRVRDNGIGVPPENREKVFQPFFTTKPTGEGTGLGLSISYEIVTQQHGGTITVDSEVGDFTEFTVRLPRRRRAVAG